MITGTNYITPLRIIYSNIYYRTLHDASFVRKEEGLAATGHDAATRPPSPWPPFSMEALPASSDSSDILVSSDSSDILVSSDSSDILVSSDSSDILVSSDSSDILVSSDSSDILVSSDSSDILVSSDSSDILVRCGKNCWGKHGKTTEGAGAPVHCRT